MRTRIYSLLFICTLLVFMVAGCLLDDDDDVFIEEDFEFESGWHSNIKATWFSVFEDEDDLSSGESAFPENDDNNFAVLNPFYCALPYNNRTMQYWYDRGYRPSTEISIDILLNEVKDQWIQIQAIVDGTTREVFCQWEDVGPWFTEDYEYVFDNTGQTRPRAESVVGERVDRFYSYTQAGIRGDTPSLSESNCNGSGIDLSPTSMRHLKGLSQDTPLNQIGNLDNVRWRFVTAEKAHAADTAENYWYNKPQSSPRRVVAPEEKLPNNINRVTKY